MLGRPALVAVDGVDGSGKTTFAARLAARYVDHGRPAHVVHMDDFLNPRAVRYRLGRDSPEGFFRDTYDLAAFAVGVIEPLSSSGEHPIVFRAFDYRADCPVHVDPTPIAAEAVVIVEGMFLHRDELQGAWDMSVFLDVPFVVEGQRIYLAACRPEQRATHVVANH